MACCLVLHWRTRCRYFTLDKVRRRRAQAARTRSLTKKKKKLGEEGSDEEDWDDGRDGAVSDGEGSDAEDDFLAGLETMQACSLVVYILLHLVHCII